MRVGVIGPTGNDTFADNILHALTELGHDAVSVGRAVPEHRPPYLTKARALLQSQTAQTEEWGQRSLIRRARLVDADVLISVENRLMPSTVRQLTCEGRVPVALWYPDALTNVGRLGMASESYSAVFLKDPVFADRMRDVYGVNAHYLPEGCTPEWHTSTQDWGVDPWISVVGNIYPTRARLIRRLATDGIPIRIFGPTPPAWLDHQLSDLHAGRSVYRQEKADVFRRSRAVLNNLHPAEMTSVNCRLFEATCAGGVVLCEFRAAIADLFDLEREVLPFATYSQLLEQCRRVLAADFDGRTLGTRAASRAISDHTVADRIAKIMGAIA